LTGGPSANSLDSTAFPGPVTLTGAEGNDTLTSGAGNDSLSGGSEDDVLTAGLGADVVQGDAGTDRLSETADANFVLTENSLTGLGGDALGGLEAASLTGGAGNNTFDLFAWAHPATINAGAGADALSVSGTGGDDNIVVTTNSVTIGALVDQFNDLETLTIAGGDGNDVFDLMNMETVLAEGQAGTALTMVNLLGGNGDDTFNLKPYPTIGITVDGGDQPNADVINFQAGGLYVPPEEGRLAAEGQQPILYSNIETVNLLQQILRIFLPFLSGPP
jgi:Ca2+-binding RTX toxin-like protein